MKTSYLIDLNLSGRRAVVVGFGSVARRKAAGLLAAGARVLAVDPNADASESREGLEVRAEPYRSVHLSGVDLAFAAATAEVNRRVVDDCRAASIWVNSATEPDEGTFAVPAIWREGVVTLGVSTGGASPALAAALRDRARAALGPAAAGLAALLAELRPLVLARVGDPMMRQRLLAEWGDAGWLIKWETEGAPAVRRELLRLLDEVVAAGPPAADVR